MIDAVLFARIRRLYYAEHWRVGAIATELGIHHDTVERAIGAERFGPAARPVRPTLLDPYKQLICDTLERHPRLRATRLLEMIRPRGYLGSYTQLREYVRTVRPRKTEAYLRLETLPGEQGQVDWGHFGTIEVGAAKRPLVCFVMVLSHSRAMHARFALDHGMESFVRGHVESFEALGGVPRQLLYDNLKSVVLDRVGDDVRFHPRILEVAGHYHFAPTPCAPYRGNEKGKVERTIQYLRHAFFAARSYSSVADLNRQLQAWIAQTAHARPCPGDPQRRPVAEVFAAEQPRLLPLPEHPFATDLVRSVTSGKQPYVRFDRNDYSIPHTLVRTPLTLIASETEVRIADAAGEAKRLVDGADEEWDAMILVGLKAGLRLGELLALRWDDVDLKAGRLVVRRAVGRGVVGTTKSGRNREVPLSGELLGALKSHRHLRGPLVFCKDNGKMLTKNQCKWPLWRACKRAGLRRIGWHVLRHSFASHLVMRGVPLKAIQELLGHATIEMTMRYAHLSPDVRRDAVNMLDEPREGHSWATSHGPSAKAAE